MNPQCDGYIPTMGGLVRLPLHTHGMLSRVNWSDSWKAILQPPRHPKFRVSFLDRPECVTGKGIFEDLGMPLLWHQAVSYVSKISTKNLGQFRFKKKKTKSAKPPTRLNHLPPSFLPNQPTNQPAAKVTSYRPFLKVRHRL